jgi:hypothetical protein
MKKTLLWFIIIALIVGGVWFFTSQPAVAPVVEAPAEKLAPETAMNAAEMIQVDLAPNTQITSPLTITGKARGPWYFEASFPIELQDNNGAVIVMTTAQAQGDWMTEDFVPFTATLTFPAQPAGSLGKIVLKRDNPSGEPQNDASMVVPVQF